MDRSHRPLVLDEAVGMLRRAPATLDVWLRGLPGAWAAANEGDGTWSPGDVVAHLTHTERTNWIPRVKRLIEHGEARAFDEFDRFGHLAAKGDETLDVRLDEFAAVRQDSLRQLGAFGLMPADLERRGMHPALGAVKLRQLLAAWVTHDLDHVFQIARVLACQYTEEVGPWRQYLRIVRDAPAEG